MSYTKIENKILEKIITSNLTYRQLKMLLLIMRFSFGFNRSFAILDKKDFFIANIDPYDVDEVLKPLLIRGVVKWDPDKNLFWINCNLKDWINKKFNIDQFKR
jgi:hypothetical protein